MNVLFGSTAPMAPLAAFDAFLPATVDGEFDALLLAQQPVADAAPAPAPACLNIAIAAAAPLDLLATLECSETMLSKAADAAHPDASQAPADALRPTDALLQPTIIPVPVALPPATLPMLIAMAPIETPSLPENEPTDTSVHEIAPDPGKSAIVSLPVASAREPAPALPVLAAVATPQVHASVERHLDLASDGAWLDTLARDIAATATQGGRLRFALAPESLGRLDVDIRSGDAGAVIQFAARSEAARDVLSAAQPQMIDQMRTNGVRVAEVAVSSALNDAATGYADGRAPDDSPRQPLPPPIETVSPRHPSTPTPETPTAKTLADGRYA